MKRKERLNEAKKVKYDEFFTLYGDIEEEIPHYKEELRGKIIYLPCDSEKSNFWKYFVNNFKEYGLKLLIATHFEKDNNSYKLEYDGEIVKKTPLKGDGDFRSKECTEIRDLSDIIIGNPPFSIFRDFFDWVIVKKFLVIAPLNMLTYKNVFTYIKDKKVCVGVHNSDSNMNFLNNDGEIKRVAATWFTNIKYVKGRIWKLEKKYVAEDYPKYDNYNAINVNNSNDIPIDYFDEMGVPATVMFKFDYDNFEIKDFIRPILNGKVLFCRYIIKRK